MSQNTRFAVAVHLVLLTAMEKEQATSKLIAQSVNTNPVVIRRLATSLQQANILESAQGKPGYCLTVDPSSLTLLDIYRATQAITDTTPFSIHTDTNINCYVGTSIQFLLESVQDEALEAMETVLKNVTLERLILQCQSIQEKQKKGNNGQ